MARSKPEPVEKPVELVRMVRTEEFARGGPTEADVHPAEVEAYRRGDWRIEGE